MTLSSLPSSSATDWKVIGLVGVAHGASHFFQLVIPSLYLALVTTFGIDFAEFGLLIAAFYVISGVGQASSGFIVDRVGGRKVLWFGLTCFVVAASLLASAQNFAMLLLAAVIGGLGNSIFHPADFAILNQRVSQPRLGHAFSTHGLTGNLGWATAPILITTLTMWGGWRLAMVVVTLLLLAVLVATVIWYPLLDTPAERLAEDGSVIHRPAPQSLAQTVGVLMASPALWGAFAFFALTSVSLSAIQNYTLPILGTLYGMSELIASSTLSGYMLAAAVGMLLGGFVATAIQNTERVVALAYCVAGSMLLMLGSGLPSGGVVLPLVVMAGFCTGVAGPSRDMLIRRVTPPGAMGSVYGLVYSGMDVGAALAPVMFGVMLDAGLAAGPWLAAGLAMWLATISAGLIAWLGHRTSKARAAMVV